MNILLKINFIAVLIFIFSGCISSNKNEKSDIESAIQEQDMDFAEEIASESDFLENEGVVDIEEDNFSKEKEGDLESSEFAEFNLEEDNFSEDLNEKGNTDDFAEFSEEDSGLDNFDEFTEESSNKMPQEQQLDSFSDDSLIAEEKPKLEALSQSDEISSTETLSPSENLSMSGETQDTYPVDEGFSSVQTGNVTSYKINNINYLANQNGGTLVIESSSPPQYSTRINESNNQFIVEIIGASLPDKLKRNLNMKDFPGSIRSVDAYQNSNGNTSRVVVQMAGAEMPTVEQEGNNLLIIAPGGNISDGMLAESNIMENNIDSSMESSSIGKENTALSQNINSLESFSADGTSFSGEKISIELKDVDVREVLNLIAEKSGANLVLSESVKGNISVKLRDVPWDQALMVIMKTKQLGVIREGNVLRIADSKEIKAEDEQSKKLSDTKIQTEPLKIKVISVGYAKMDDLTGQIKPFLSERGKVVGDGRTSSLVITDVPSVISRIVKLVKVLDVMPSQVLIEGKVIEAREQFSQNLGINWQFSGSSNEIMTNSNGAPVNLTPSVRMNPIGTQGSIALGMNFNVTSLDFLGDLNSYLSLYEKEDEVKIISSPRIMAMHNESAEISQDIDFPIVTSTIVEGNERVSVEFKPVKLKLNVTPHISSENTVILNVEVLREFLGAPDPIAKAPPVNKRSAKTKILVRNGQTAVIGGIYQSDISSSEVGTPWLRKIPLIGALFRARTYSKDKNELLIFLTPKIVAKD